MIRDIPTADLSLTSVKRDEVKSTMENQDEYSAAGSEEISAKAIIGFPD